MYQKQSNYDDGYREPKHNVRKQDKRAKQQQKAATKQFLTTQVFPGSSMELPPTADDGRQRTVNYTSQEAIRAGPHCRNPVPDGLPSTALDPACAAALRELAKRQILPTAYAHTDIHTYTRNTTHTQSYNYNQTTKTQPQTQPQRQGTPQHTNTKHQGHIGAGTVPNSQQLADRSRAAAHNNNINTLRDFGQGTCGVMFQRGIFGMGKGVSEVGHIDRIEKIEQERQTGIRLIQGKGQSTYGPKHEAYSSRHVDIQQQQHEDAQEQRGRSREPRMITASGIFSSRRDSLQQQHEQADDSEIARDKKLQSDQLPASYMSAASKPQLLNRPPILLAHRFDAIADDDDDDNDELNDPATTTTTTAADGYHQSRHEEVSPAPVTRVRLGKKKQDVVESPSLRTRDVAGEKLNQGPPPNHPAERTDPRLVVVPSPVLPEVTDELRPSSSPGSGRHSHIGTSGSSEWRLNLAIKEHERATNHDSSTDTIVDAEPSLRQTCVVDAEPSLRQMCCAVSLDDPTLSPQILPPSYLDSPSPYGEGPADCDGVGAKTQLDVEYGNAVSHGVDELVDPSTTTPDATGSRSCCRGECPSCLRGCERSARSNLAMRRRRRARCSRVAMVPAPGSAWCGRQHAPVGVPREAQTTPEPTTAARKVADRRGNWTPSIERRTA